MENGLFFIMYAHVQCANVIRIASIRRDTMR